MRGAKILNIFGKKIVVIMILILTTVFLFGFSVEVFALEVGLDILGETGLGSTNLILIIVRIIQIALGLLAIIALIIILYGGFIWMTSGGDADKIQKAKRTLANAAIGLLIILLSLSIVTFLIDSLFDVFFGPPRIPNPPSWQGCTNCGALGGGIIESVYPEPGAKDVPRNTSIFVTFKEEMDISTILDISNCEPGYEEIRCDLATTEGEPNVKIHVRSEGEENYLLEDVVTASRINTGEFKTFKFKSHDYLGSSDQRMWYTVRLGSDISKFESGESAFPGIDGEFTWSFEVSTFLDLDPPYVDNVFPVPDDTQDNYITGEPIQAEASFTISDIPQVASASFVDPTTLDASFHTGSTSDADVTGNYSCSVAARLCITNLATGFSANLHQGGSCTGTILNDPNLINNPTFNAAGEYIDIGCGLRVHFTELNAVPPVPLVSGQQWWFDVEPEYVSDTLNIANRTYSFVNSGATGNQINVSDINTTFNNIANTLSADSQLATVVSITASAFPSISFRAVNAGNNSNAIPITASSQSPPAWADITSFSGGQDEGLYISIIDEPDQPRNAIIRIDFSETMDPTAIAGVVQTNGSTVTEAGTGEPVIGALEDLDFSNITVQIDYDGIDNNGDGNNFDPNEYIAGTFEVSNLYKTVEFTPSRYCLDEAGNPIENSCGDRIYCLATASQTTIPCADDAACDAALTPEKYYCDTDTSLCVPYAAQYLVNIKAATLKAVACVGDPVTECTDSNYPAITTVLSADPNLCACADPDVTPAQFYPEMGPEANGAGDAASNSFNGNWDTDDLAIYDSSPYHYNVWGPGPEGAVNQSGRPPFNLNAESGLDGDSLMWSFYINENIDLDPPIIENVTPDPNDEYASLIDPLEAQFSKLLMSSSLKPDNSYEDGYCYCTDSNDCESDQGCVENRCINIGRQEYCRRDRDCKNSSNYCQNKEHLTMINHPTRPSGYWITSTGEDNTGDGWDDYTTAIINHTPYRDFTTYGGRAGSGIKDVYQNCYLPGVGEGGCTAADIPADVSSCVTTTCAQAGGEECTGTDTCQDDGRNVDYVYSAPDAIGTCCLSPGSCQ